MTTPRRAYRKAAGSYKMNPIIIPPDPTFVLETNGRTFTKDALDAALGQVRLPIGATLYCRDDGYRYQIAYHPIQTRLYLRPIGIKRLRANKDPQ